MRKYLAMALLVGALISLAGVADAVRLDGGQRGHGVQCQWDGGGNLSITGPAGAPYEVYDHTGTQLACGVLHDGRAEVGCGGNDPLLVIVDGKKCSVDPNWEWN